MNPNPRGTDPASKILYAGVDLGGTNIGAAMADESGRILAESTQPTRSHEGHGAILERIARMIDELAAQVGGRMARLGLGAPGLVDLATGTTRFLPNLPGHWHDVPVRAILEPRIGCPVQVLNDARTAALGDLLLEPMRQVISNRVRMFPTDGVRLERSSLGDKAGVLGAIALAQQRGLPPEFNLANSNRP
jgi:predicted NBD/HSP70 family sugar kinase